MTRIANLTAAIATLDRPAAFARCLDALLAGETLPAEIVVVDQSEGDETRAVIEQRRAPGVRIHYVRQERRGLSASRNAAIARAGLSWIAITDDDCVPDHLWVATIERVVSSENPPDAVTGRVLPLGPETPGLYAVSSRTNTTRAEFTGKVEPWRVGTGGNCAVARRWVDQIGLYDERLGAGSAGGGGEDMDFFYRLTRAGARVLYEPDALIYHERQSKRRRIASRSSYGRGMGTFCGIWLRRRDLFALYILYRWLFIHCWMMVSGLRRGNWTKLYEEFLMLQGTVRGLVRGLCEREIKR
jgi:GT2 family glycosyltransferase